MRLTTTLLHPNQQTPPPPPPTPTLHTSIHLSNPHRSLPNHYTNSHESTQPPHSASSPISFSSIAWWSLVGNDVNIPHVIRFEVCPFSRRSIILCVFVCFLYFCVFSMFCLFPMFLFVSYVFVCFLCFCLFLCFFWVFSTQNYVKITIIITVELISKCLRLLLCWLVLELLCVCAVMSFIQQVSSSI